MNRSPIALGRASPAGHPARHLARFLEERLSAPLLGCAGFRRTQLEERRAAGVIQVCAGLSPALRHASPIRPPLSGSNSGDPSGTEAPKTSDNTCQGPTN